MKKITLILAALCCMCLTTKAQTPVITVADVEAVPGETVTFALSLSNGEANKYKSLDYHVTFPATGFTTTGVFHFSESWLGATTTIGAIDNEGLLTVGAASGNTISEADVENLMTFKFTVADNVPLGEYTVTVSNIKLGYNTNDEDTPANTSFKVNVVARHTAVLDEESTTAPAAATGVDVTVKRTLKAGIWNTICLPFAMTAAQITDAFGEGTLLGDFVKFETTWGEGVHEDDALALTVSFNSVDAIEANHPYIIKIGDDIDITEFVVENVDITPNENEACVEYDNGKTGSKRQVFGTFYGTYKVSTIENNCLFLSNNKFWYSDGDTSIKAFRGYFDFVDVLANNGIQAEPSRMFIVYDGEVTAVEPVKAKPAVEDGVYYNLMGVAVKNPDKGVFIKDGKKIVVK